MQLIFPQYTSREVDKIRYYILPHRDKCDGKEYEDFAGDLGYFENQRFYVYRNFRLITGGLGLELLIN